MERAWPFPASEPGESPAVRGPQHWAIGPAPEAEAAPPPGPRDGQGPEPAGALSAPGPGPLPGEGGCPHLLMRCGPSSTAQGPQYLVAQRGHGRG